MSSRLVVVRIAHDDEAGVWYVEKSDVPGLNAEADTVDALIRRIPDMVLDLLEENGLDGFDVADLDEVPIEIIASQGTRVKLTRAAA